MKVLVVQMQPHLAKDVNAPELCRCLELFASEPLNILESSTSSGDDNGPYINVSFSTDALPALWREFREKCLIANDPDIAKIAIITCQGSHGWDDYLLLHHYDSEEKLDSLWACDRARRVSGGQSNGASCQL